jgi:hypothetical protein
LNSSRLPVLDSTVQVQIEPLPPRSQLYHCKVGNYRPSSPIKVAEGARVTLVIAVEVYALATIALTSLPIVADDNDAQR